MIRWEEDLHKKADDTNDCRYEWVKLREWGLPISALFVTNKEHLFSAGLRGHDWPCITLRYFKACFISVKKYMNAKKYPSQWLKNLKVKRCKPWKGCWCNFFLSFSTRLAFCSLLEKKKMRQEMFAGFLLLWSIFFTRNYFLAGSIRSIKSNESCDPFSKKHLSVYGCFLPFNASENVEETFLMDFLVRQRGATEEMFLQIRYLPQENKLSQKFKIWVQHFCQ